MVPKHEILSAKEKKEVLGLYGITKEKLPKIAISDPVIKAIEAKAGDVIRITRNSETAGKAVYYRVVVEA
jgi:DNA-directed RNA polymerase subunit H